MLLRDAKVSGPNSNSFLSNSLLLVFFGDPTKLHKNLLKRRIGIKIVKWRCFLWSKPLFPVNPGSVSLKEVKIEGQLSDMEYFHFFR